MSKHEVVTEETVAEKFGISARQYADFAILRGDPSDGLPGVKGVGDKTAAKLLGEFGDLAGIIMAVSDPESSLTKGQRTNLEAAADYLAAAPKVVRVVRNLPVGDDVSALERPRSFAHPEQVQDLAARWGLGGSVDRLAQALAG